MYHFYTFNHLYICMHIYECSIHNVLIHLLKLVGTHYVHDAFHFSYSF